MEALVLSYFDTIIGPVITHTLSLGDSSIPAELPLDLQLQIQKFIDSHIDDGFFFHGFKTYKTANINFQISSDWARGKKEMLCLSIITQITLPLKLFKATLEAGVTRLQAIPGLYKAFYREKQPNDEDVAKKQKELQESLAKLCQDVIHAKEQAIAIDIRSDQNRNETRDRDRDEARDETRDSDRDEARDETRDSSRDEARDETRDEGRDGTRDKTRDKSRDKTRDVGRDETRDEGRDETRDVGRDETRDKTRDKTRDSDRDKE
jgi:hypothetical protein